MPAKTSPKKTAAVKKPAAKKPTAAHKNGNGNGLKNGANAAMQALEAEHQKAQSDLAAAWDHIAELEKQLAEAKATGAKTADVEQQLRETQAKLTTHQAELEASRAES